MKKFICATLVAAACLVQSCNTTEARYINPDTGQALNLEKDETTGLMVDTTTGQPVKIYVDTETKDTVWGKTGKVINGKLRQDKGEDGKVVYVFLDENDETPATANENGSTTTESGAYEIKSGDYKKEVEKDGDIKIKDGNKKIKINGETGETKVKYDN